MPYKYLLFALFVLNNYVLADSTKQNFLLDIPIPIMQPANLNGKTLYISTPKAVAGFDTANQLYIRNKNVLEYYSKSQWVDTPAQMLLPFLVLYMEASGQFKTILSAITVPIITDLRLDIEIIRLYQDFLTEPSQLVLILRVQLLDMEQREVIATHLFEYKKEAGFDVRGAVVATNEAVIEFLNELTVFIERALSE